jgi:hypothetical protein
VRQKQCKTKKKNQMINRLPKHYREKYKKKRGWDEELIMFAFKVVGSTALVFIVAAGVDVYHLIH